MSKVVKNQSFIKNGTVVDTSDSNVRFSQEETDAFIKRLKSIISTESLSSFAKRCGFGESLLRKYLNGAVPGADKIIAIAKSNGKTVEWLLTGDWPESKSDLRRVVEYASIDPSEIVKNFTGIDIINRDYPSFGKYNNSLNQDSVLYKTETGELRPDRRISQATFKEAQVVADINYEFLAAAERAVHRFMIDEDFVQPPERVAKLVIALYKYAVAKGMAKPDELEQFIKLVA